MGERLRFWREKRGWTLAELSERSGVKLSTISEIEAGRIKRSTFANRLAEALGISPDWLLDGTGEPEIEGVEPLELGEPEMVERPYRLQFLRHAYQRSRGIVGIPQLDVAAGMSLVGREVGEHLDVVRFMKVEVNSLRSLNVTFSHPSNLRLLTGYGDSMRGTYNHGDPLLIDVGVAEVEFDGVYVIQRDSELFVKRVQRHLTQKGALIVSSDNEKYRSFEVTDAERDQFRIVARVLLAWNARPL